MGPTMIEEQGDILDIRGDRVGIAMRRRSACAGCSARRGCGHGMLDAWLGGRQARLELSLAAQDPRIAGALMPGARVRLGVSPRTLLMAALRLHGLPLVGLLVGLALGQGLGASDLAAASGGLLGLLTVGLVLRGFGSPLPPPRILGTVAGALEAPACEPISIL